MLSRKFETQIAILFKYAKHSWHLNWLSPMTPISIKVDEKKNVNIGADVSDNFNRTPSFNFTDFHINNIDCNWIACNIIIIHNSIYYLKCMVEWKSRWLLSENKDCRRMIQISNRLVVFNSLEVHICVTYLWRHRKKK